MNRNIIYILLFIEAVFFSVSCDRNLVYEKYAPIPEMGWPADSIICFNVNISDTTQNNNLYFNIRNSIDYPYSNIWLFISITPPKGDILTDTIEFTLAGPGGEWFGKGHGKFRDNQFIFRRNVYFPNPGQYKFQLQHGMRTKELKGVSNVGIRVEKTD